MADSLESESPAQQRTEYSEDRTVLANERTFASWVRTGFGAAAIGLGFQALFQKMEPSWVPRALASLFLLLAIYVFVSAERRACKVLHRLKAHKVTPFDTANLRLLSYAAAAGVAALMVAMWVLPLRPR